MREPEGRFRATVAGTRYLIVGGGMTADAACRGIREHDPDGSIVLVGAEDDPPYNRPPLTKGLWEGERGGLDLARDRASSASSSRLGRRVVSLDLATRTAVDDRGETHGYDRLLLATGGRPRRLPFGGDDVVYFRTLADYRRVRALADGGLAVRRDRRRLHRLRARRGARVERPRGRDRLPRGRGLRAALPARSSRRSSPTTTASTASRCTPAGP